jgi:hypothetical protein
MFGASTSKENSKCAAGLVQLSDASALARLMWAMLLHQYASVIAMITITQFIAFKLSLIQTINQQQFVMLLLALDG